MKKHLLPLILFAANCFLIQVSHAQDPAWLWARSAGGTGAEAGNLVAADDSGNLYVAGYFKSASLTLGSFTLIRTGSCNIFLAKYDGSGNVAWAVSPQGTGNDIPCGIAVDGSGNVVVAGYFSSPVITFGTFSLTNAGIQDAFLAKYDAGGNALWAKRAGGADWDDAGAVAADDSGNIYLAGSFRSPQVTFGSFTLTNTAPGIYDAFLVKYDGGGNELWARLASGPGNNNPSALSVDASGKVILAGNFTGSSMTLGSFTINGIAATDIFIARYDESGEALWARSEGGDRDDKCYSLACDGPGNIFMAGMFGSQAITFGTFLLANSAGFYPSTDMFLVKYDASGNVNWATGAFGLMNDVSTSVISDTEGNVYATGYFYSDTIRFGSTALANARLFSYCDLFVVKYKPSGNLEWAIRAGGQDDDKGNSIARDETGFLYVTGDFASQFIAFGEDTLHNQGNVDLFLAKLDDNIISAPESPKAGEYRIFPNPASIKITITTPPLSPGTWIEIRNVYGELVIRQIAAVEKTMIGIHRLLPGFYIISIIGTEGIRAGSFIKAGN